MGPPTCGVYGSFFDLEQLRTDMQAHWAVYLGQDTVQGQGSIAFVVIACLLLDARKLPVNVLSNASGSGPGQALSQRLTMLPVTQVPAALWEARIRAEFRIGVLPVRSGHQRNQPDLINAYRFPSCAPTYAQDRMTAGDEVTALCRSAYCNSFPVAASSTSTPPPPGPKASPSPT